MAEILIEKIAKEMIYTKNYDVFEKIRFLRN